MKKTIASQRAGWRLAPRTLAFALLSTASLAQAGSVVFTLSDLHLQGPSGQNGWPLAVDVTVPGAAGHFRWTYVDGDFQNGTATLLDLALPITSLPLSLATTTASLTAVTGTYAGNAQNLSYDFSIVFTHALGSATDSTSIDAGASTFDFTGAYAGGSPFSEWTGSIVGGTVGPSAAVVPGVPEPSTALLTLAGGCLAWVALRRRPAAAMCATPS